jgi:hypothetical protein
MSPIGPSEEILAVTLARIETKLDQAIRSDDDHERRLRHLEANRWPLPSAAVLLSVAAVIIPFVR